MTTPFISLDQGRLTLEYTPQGYKDTSGNLYAQNYGAQGSGYYLIPSAPISTTPVPNVSTSAPTGATSSQNQPSTFSQSTQTVPLAGEPVANSQGYTAVNGAAIDNATGRRIINNGLGWHFAEPAPTSTPATPTSQYTGPSIVDYLNSIGKPSDFDSRRILAQQSGINNYTGTAQQNTQLLSQLRSAGIASGAQPPTPIGSVPVVPKAPPAPPAPSASTTPPVPEIDFQSQVRNLMQEFGISPISSNTNLFSALTDYLNQAYTNLGLTDLKIQIGNTTKQIQAIDTELAQKEASINDNPFISEGLRSRQVIKARELSDRKKEALVNRLRLDETTYEHGVQQAQFVAQQALTLTHQQQQVEQEFLLRAMSLAEKRMEAEKKLNQAAGTITPHIVTDDKGNVTIIGTKPLGESSITAKYSTIGKTRPQKSSIGGFTNAQMNAGAASSRLPMNEFNLLDTDTKNYFINNKSSVNKKFQTIDQAKTNQENPDDLKKEVADSNMPDNVKDIFTVYIDKNVPVPNKGFWGRLWDKLTK